MNFKEFRKKLLIEKATSEISELKHLTHIEDLIFEGKKAGKIGIEFLKDIVISISNGNSDKISIQAKVDGCIHPDTIIKTKNNGYMKIGDIIKNNINDEVYTYNFEDNKQEYSKIEFPRINDNNKKWIELELENGSIKLTEDHKVYIKNKGWIEAKDLKEGDDIFSIKDIDE